MTGSVFPDENSRGPEGGAMISGPGGGGMPWIRGYLSTPRGFVPRVSVKLSLSDRLGSWKVRWGIGRMRYRLPPGLYGVGEPDDGSPVLVTANYKLTFDTLRRHLVDRDLWILVLDTDGINVWCAAGGGKFNAAEVTARVDSEKLSQVVSHRTLILPQLAAPGVAAREVTRTSGFRVVFGPVRAGDIPRFLDAGMEATVGMRRVTFGFAERAVLVPVELVLAGRYILPLAAGMFFLSGLRGGAFSVQGVYAEGWVSVLLLLAGYFGGGALVPLVLPFVPGRAFSLKGAIVGAVIAALSLFFLWGPFDPFPSALAGASWLFMIPAVSSFLAMNFTGSTPYTSLSGVRREIRIALPAQIALSAAGLAMWLAGRFI